MVQEQGTSRCKVARVDTFYDYQLLLMVYDLLSNEVLNILSCSTRIGLLLDLREIGFTSPGQEKKDTQHLTPVGCYSTYSTVESPLYIPCITIPPIQV